MNLKTRFSRRGREFTRELLQIAGGLSSGERLRVGVFRPELIEEIIPRSCVQVADLSGVPVGMMMGTAEADEAVCHLATAVIPECRGWRIGREMHEEFEKNCGKQQCGIRIWRAETMEPAAVRIVRGLGYSERPDRRGCYDKARRGG